MCERRIKQTCSRCPALVSKLIALKPDIFYRKPSINWCPGNRRGIACIPTFPKTTTPTQPHTVILPRPRLSNALEQTIHTRPPNF